jgi:hypothetical protein
MVRIRTSRRWPRAAAMVAFIVLVVGSAVSLGRTPIPGSEPDQKFHGSEPHQKSDFHHAPGSIIGKETPHLIPDEVAIGLLFRGIADLNDRGLVSVYLDHIERITNQSLEASDREAILSAAKTYREQTRTIGLEGATTGVPPAEYPQQSIKSAKEQWLELSTSMTPHGKALLQRYVEGHHKTTMKVLKPLG